MPANISNDFKTMLAGETLTLAILCRLKRRDGVVLGFTNHQADIIKSDAEVGTLLYRAGQGFTPYAWQTASGMSIDNSEVRWVLNEDVINEEDLRAGRFDGCEVKFFIIDYTNLALGVLNGPGGHLGQVKFSEDGTALVEFRALSQKTSNDVLEVTSLLCRCKRLGDVRCGFNLAGNTADGYPSRTNGWVTSVANRRQFISNLSTVSGSPLDQANLYAWPTITFTNSVSDDDNNPYKICPVNSFDGSEFRLTLNANIRKKITGGMTGTAQSIKFSNSVAANFSFEVASARKLHDDSWAVKVKSSFWPTPANQGIGYPSQFFRNGIIKWTSGLNAGLEMVVIEHDAQAISLLEPMPFSISASDAYTLEVGCDRTIEMCFQRFNNCRRFRGEPYIMPLEKVLEIDKA